MFKIFLKILGFFFGFMISDSKAVFIYVILMRVVKQKYYSPPSKDSLSLLQSPGLVQTFKEFIWDIVFFRCILKIIYFLAVLSFTAAQAFSLVVASGASL